MQREFQIIDRQVLNGREAYKNLFSRQERRDLSKKQFVVQLDNGRLILSSGIFHQDGTFQESVERITVASDAVQDDAAKLRTIIAAGSATSAPGQAFAGRIDAFTVKIADAGLSVENTRNEILQHVEEIRGMENDLNATRRQQRQFTLLMGGLAVLANMLVLYFLVRFIIERPLHKLTQTIDAIRAGESPEVPYRQRKDQIGILSGAIGINEVSAATGSTRDLADRVHEFSSEISSQLTRLLRDTTTSLRQLTDFSSPEPAPKSKVRQKETLRLVTVHQAQSRPLFAALPPTGTTGA